jgi:NAD(P)-dependent dehydrogenase (short-subunit alcohol dehydrogenase family)
MNFETLKTLITGGSSGIGKAIIAELYQRGARDIAIVGRSLEKMKALEMDYPDARFIYLNGEISNVDDIKDFIEAVKHMWGKIDLLINNAGVVSAGLLEQISDEDIIAQLNINITGPILLTKYALPLLKKSDEAVIMNISSGLGLIGLPFYTTYAASKAAIRHFSESLRRELAAFPIHVMTIYPTSTDTPMMHTADITGMDTPELVASHAINGLIDKKIDVIMGGEQQLNNHKLNFEHPLEYDEMVKMKFNTMAKRAIKHRSM